MSDAQHSEAIAELVHEKSVEILVDVGFCVPEDNVLSRLERLGFLTDKESQMVRLTPDLLESALSTLPRNVRLYNQEGEVPARYGNGSCFMGAGTPVNVFDLHSVRAPLCHAAGRAPAGHHSGCAAPGGHRATRRDRHRPGRSLRPG